MSSLRAGVWVLGCLLLGAPGLAIASDIGILLQTASLAVLLHHKRLAGFSGLEWGELARSFLAAVAGFAALAVPAYYGAFHGVTIAGTFSADLRTVCIGTVVWGAVCFLVLKISGSKLPEQVLSRFRR